MILKMEQITKVYGKQEAAVKALDAVNLCVKRGEMLCINGVSGSGKSTLLNLIGCMDTATSGSYEIDGKHVERLSVRETAALRNKMFGFIVQDYALIEYETVYKNVELPLIYAGIRKKERKERVQRVLQQLGIAEKEEALVSHLSGGQKQRVAIGRALVNDAEIILADEPTGALDRANGVQVMEILKKLNALGKTVILVTHDMDMAAQCKRIVRIEDGRVISDEVTV